MADNKIDSCKCSKTIKNQTQQFEEQSFAMTMLKETAKNGKRWFIIAMVILVMWLSTIGAFLAYLNQYDFSSYSVQGTQDGNGLNIIGGGDVYNGADR